MLQLHFSIRIQAPRQRVWYTLISADGYKAWTKAFNPHGSWFEGDWSQGSTITFLWPYPQNPDRIWGMRATVAENTQFEKIVLSYIWEVSNSELNTDSDRVGITESYTLEQVWTETVLSVQVGMLEAYADFMETSRNQALQDLKQLCEVAFPKITVQQRVTGDIGTIRDLWTLPQHITQWNQASPDRHCPKATNDLQVSWRFCSTMAARDGSFSFDFGGTYTEVLPQQKISYIMDDGRTATVLFEELDGAVLLTETFDAESTHSLELQEQWWGAIMASFAAYAQTY